MKDKVKNIIWILFFVFTSLLVEAQIYPTDKLVLRHTQIMFAYPQVRGAQVYEIEIAANNPDSFNNRIIYLAKDSSTAHLVKEKLFFGNSYKWHYCAYSNGKKIFHSKDYLFSIVNTKLVSDFRANAITNDSTKIQNGLILLDNGVIIDRKGNLVLITDSFGVEKRDFSLTPQNTLTYLQTTSAYEKSLNGDLIWKTKEIKTEKELIYNYHHDLIKLKNGNYLVLCKVKELNNPLFKNNLDEGIVELDSTNHIVWLWKEFVEITDTIGIKKTHLNSIYLNEPRNKLFVSGRDINTIFRIDRATSKIESCIGTLLNSDGDHYPQNLFSGQHSVQLLENGNILLFNNNVKTGRNGVSSILEINQPNKKSPQVAVKFGYIYMFENQEENFCAKGGDVNKLKNGNYLVSSSANNRNFELSQSKKIVWQCQPEKFDTITKLWIPLGSYRINFSESLYPYYFTIEVIYQNKSKIGYKITNKGSNEETYKVEIITSKGLILKESQIIVAPNQNIKMLFDKNIVKNCQVKISSLSAMSSKVILIN